MEKLFNVLFQDKKMEELFNVIFKDKKNGKKIV